MHLERGVYCVTYLKNRIFELMFKELKDILLKVSVLAVCLVTINFGNSPVASFLTIMNHIEKSSLSFSGEEMFLADYSTDVPYEESKEEESKSEEEKEEKEENEKEMSEDLFGPSHFGKINLINALEQYSCVEYPLYSRYFQNINTPPPEA